MSEIVTPDGITESGKKFIWEKLSWKYSPEEIKDILSTIDKESRQAMLNRSAWTKVSDAFKHALPLVNWTAEKMSKEYANLFNKEIPEDIAVLKTQLSQVANKKY